MCIYIAVSHVRIYLFFFYYILYLYYVVYGRIRVSATFDPIKRLIKRHKHEIPKQTFTIKIKSKGGEWANVFSIVLFPGKVGGPNVFAISVQA